jgi:hypothetical protein
MKVVSGEREREREKREIGEVEEVRDTTVLGRGEVIETKFCGFEGSLTVPASPSGRGEACVWDLFNFNF